MQDNSAAILNYFLHIKRNNFLKISHLSSEKMGLQQSGPIHPDQRECDSLFIIYVKAVILSRLRAVLNMNSTMTESAAACIPKNMPKLNTLLKKIPHSPLEM